MDIDRRKFFKFAGSLGLVHGVTNIISPNTTEAATWHKIGGNVTVSTLVRGPGYRKLPTVACGNAFTSVIRSDGLIFSTGANTYGQIGDGILGDKATFVQGLGVSDIIAISASRGGHSLALRADGNLYAVGRNFYGQLGDGATDSRSSYVSVAISSVIAIATGEEFTLVLRSGGEVFACGLNDVGQFGDGGVFGSSVSFIQAVGTSKVIAIAAGAKHSLTLQTDGYIYGSGLNSHGELGTGDNFNKSAFIPPSSASYIKFIGCGENHSLAINLDGKVLTTGWNQYGELGLGHTAIQYGFHEATGISNAIAVAGGGRHSLALRSDGLVFACGDNGSGQLGDGSTAARSTFVQVTGISNAIAIACGFDHSIALRSDGVVYGTGSSSRGEIGDNDTVDRSIFTQSNNP